MPKEIEDHHNGGFSFSDDGKVWYMSRCHKCLKENYAMAVASGVCAWCGFNRNEEV